METDGMYDEDYLASFFLKKFYFKSPAKLHFKYTAMNGGKSAALLQIAHNYRANNNQTILVAKPNIDTKGGAKISSRIGDDISIDCDFTIQGGESLMPAIYYHMKECAKKENGISAILIDEAQFLERLHVEELAYICTIIGIPVICFGLRTDFRGIPFEGASWLFAYAQDIEELATRPMSALGNKNKKASMNIRLVNDVPSFEGEQVFIDGESDRVEYLPVSLNEFLRLRGSKGALKGFGSGIEAVNAYDFIETMENN